MFQGRKITQMTSQTNVVKEDTTETGSETKRRQSTPLTFFPLERNISLSFLSCKTKEEGESDAREPRTKGVICPLLLL